MATTIQNSKWDFVVFDTQSCIFRGFKHLNDAIESTYVPREQLAGLYFIYLDNDSYRTGVRRKLATILIRKQQNGLGFKYNRETIFAEQYIEKMEYYHNERR